jgi:two-component system sensor kinase FixL
MRRNVSSLIESITTRYVGARHWWILGVALVSFVAIVIADAALPDISLGFLYIVPIVLAAGHLSRRQIIVSAICCAVLRQALGRWGLDWDAAVRFAISTAAFSASGLFVSEMVRNRRIMAQHLDELQREVELRTEAQEQLAVLIDTSPAAILIIDAEGTVLRANESASHMLGFPPGKLAGENIHPYLPAVETVPVGSGRRSLRSTLECRGHRRNGALFLAQIWFSTFETSSGPRIAAIVLDASEGLRDREGAGLSSLMHTSRVLMGAVSHSVRNLCAASRISYANLERMPGLRDSEDLKALGTLIRGLESIATTDLERACDRSVTTVDLATLLDELRVVIEPSFEEAGIELKWDVSQNLPAVVGEHYGLLHAFLNLTQNGERALAGAPWKRFEVVSRSSLANVELSFSDTAGGVRNPEALFQPFHHGASGTGLGLYVSRAVIRSFDGDLHYEPITGGSRFRVTLRTAYNRNVHTASDHSEVH